MPRVDFHKGEISPIVCSDGWKTHKDTSSPKQRIIIFQLSKVFFIVLLALVDANYKFIVVHVGELGKNSGGIYSRSALAKRLEKNTLNIPGPKSLPHMAQVFNCHISYLVTKLSH